MEQARLRFLVFRMFTFTIGRNVALADWVKRKIITGIFIHRRRPTNMAVRRTITFHIDGPEIDDEFLGLSPNQIISLRAGDIFTTIYMASAKYYRTQDSIEDLLSGDELSGTLSVENCTLNYGSRNGTFQRLASKQSKD